MTRHTSLIPPVPLPVLAVRKNEDQNTTSVANACYVDFRLTGVSDLVVCWFPKSTKSANHSANPELTGGIHTRIEA